VRRMKAAVALSETESMAGRCVSAIRDARETFDEFAPAVRPLRPVEVGEIGLGSVGGCV
jgi:hypothetical protein